MNILSAKYLISSPSLELSPEYQLPEFAFIGRSNVGKSSLINAVVNHKGLAKTSSTPGKTRLINFFSVASDVGDFIIVDLPGYGYAKTSKTSRQQWVDASSHYLSHRKELAHLFVLVDLRIPPQSIDMEFMRWAVEQNIPFSIVATKADKLNQKQSSSQTRLFKQFHDTLGLETQLIITSGLAKLGIEKIHTTIEKIIILDLDQS